MSWFIRLAQTATRLKCPLFLHSQGSRSGQPWAGGHNRFAVEMSFIRDRFKQLCRTTTLSPVNAAPILRVEKLFIERNIGADIGIFFRGCDLAVVHEDYLRRDPGAAFCALILIELDVRRRCAILARWSE